MQKISKSWAVDIKSSRLMSCLSLSTITLLVLASVVIITIISVTPIIILGIGELPEGQRDIIIKPRLQHLNATQLSTVGGVTAMPRLAAAMLTPAGRQLDCWFMDFTLEKEKHLGTIGGGEPAGHSYIYAHEDTGLEAEQQVNLTFLHKHTLLALQTALQERHIQTPNSDKIMQEIALLLRPQVSLTGQFTVKYTFDTAAGKFGIGHVNNNVYLDLRSAFQQIVQQTLAAMQAEASDT